MLDRILRFGLTQRFLVLVGMGLLVGVGVLSWQNLTLDAVPDVTPNQVVINTPTPGMGTAEAERMVTFPIEAAMAGIPGVQQVRSLSFYGLSQVTVTFGDDTQVYFARQLVTERLGPVREQLPVGVPAPQLGPVSTGLGDIYHYVLESDSKTPMELRTLQDWTIKPLLRTVPGVAEVNVTGGDEKQYEVDVDPSRLYSRGLSLHQITEALLRNNANSGGGFIESNGEQTTIRSVGRVSSLTDIGAIVVSADKGIPIYVRDVARVTIGGPLRTGVATKDGKEAVIGSVLMLQGANGRTVANAVDLKLKAIRGLLPADVRVIPVYDRSTLVNQTIHTVERSLVEGGLLVLAILLVLLGNIRGALIVSFAIPLAMLFATTAMNLFGISGNLMSLGAIDFGLIVDGAVVMVEHCVRRTAEARLQVGRKLTRNEVRSRVADAADEVAKPVAFAVSIITVVYLPIVTLQGIEGKMFKPMAFTVVFALLGSLLLTLLLIPALCSLILSGDTAEGRNVVMQFLVMIYRPVLNFALKRRALVAAGAISAVALASVLFTHLGAEFIPQLDEGSLDLHPTRLRTVDASETVRLLTAMERTLKRVPEVLTVFSRAGAAEVATDPQAMSTGDSFVMLRSREQWRTGMTKAKLIDDIQDRLKNVPGQVYGVSQPIQDRFDDLTSGVKADVGIKVFGEDLDMLKTKADEVANAIRKVPGAADVSVEQVDNIPVLEVQINRQAVARVGVSVADIQEWFETALGGRSLGEVLVGDKRFALTVRLPQSMRNSLEAIKALPITTPLGGSVQLSRLATIVSVPAPAQISREHGSRRVVVQCSVEGRDLEGFVEAAKGVINRHVRLPEGYYIEWAGQFENLQRAKARLTLVVPVALGLIFVLLFSTFGSLRQAILIFTGVPLAVTGGIIALWLRGLAFSISAGVGFIALSGVAVLNGVVMVSAINQLRAEGASVYLAVGTGAMQRLRPVLMTALVAALGFVPMALNTGIGAEVQRPLATVVIGGIISSTLLTLVVLPMLYNWLEHDASPDPE